MVEVKMSEFFNPRGVAVIGASDKKGNPNNQIFKYSMEASLNGKVFPINPKADKIEGVDVYRSLMDIPDSVDLIVMAVGSKSAISVAKEIKERREARGDAGAVVIVSAGFKEVGTKEAIELQDEMISIMKSSGARVIGPNCQGVVDLYHGINTTFSVPPKSEKGGLSIISQSGAFATSFIRWAKEHKLVGINKFVTLGNMADVDVTEVLEYMAEDEKTKVIAMYLEGTKKARGLIEAAKKVSLKKPIVAIKGGRTSLGSNIAHSHTASIAGDDAIYDGAFNQAGILRANSISEFYHTARVFDKMPVPKGNKICLLTAIGGPSTICVDVLVSSGEVQLAHLSEEIKEKIRNILAPSANVGNPDGYIDMTASVNPGMHRDIINLLMEDNTIDGIIFLTAPPGFISDDDMAQAIIDGYNSVSDDKKKTLLSVFMAGNDVARCRRILEENNFPTFEYSDDAARVMVNMVRYGQYLQRNR